uniref:Eye-specific diacylglycerol kinase n=1 Tax=Anopheles maculatus TaxID=74869 RepID=A0A182SMT0_9DIPT
MAGSASDEGSAVAAAFLDVPKRFQRRKSSSKTPPPCIHCLYLEEYRRLIGVEQRLRPRTDCEAASSSGPVALLSPPPVASPCRITLTLSPTKPDDGERCISYSHGGSSTLEATGVGEIALMLPDEDFDAAAGGDTRSAVREHEPRPRPVSAATVTSESVPEATGDAAEPVSPAANRTRRRSISRQEAIIVEPTGSSLENVSNASDSRPPSPTASRSARPVPDILTGEDELDNQSPQQRPPQRGRAASMGPIIPSSSPPPLPACPFITARPPRFPPPHQQHIESVGIPLESPPPSATISVVPAQQGDFVRDIYLQVPDLKRDRAASVDSCFTKVTGAKTEELQPPPDGACLNLLAVPSSGAVRSRSVDIVLPTEQQARYKALALAGPSGSANSAGASSSGTGTGGHLAPGVRGFEFG